MWFYRNSSVRDDFCPDYLSKLTFGELKQNVYQHMYTLAKRYRGRIDTWEINEMNLAWANYLNLTNGQKFELIRTFTDAVKAANPEAKVLMNSMALPFEFGPARSDHDTIPYPAILDQLGNRGWSPDIIGLEFYYSGVTVDGYVQPVLGIAAVSQLLDEYSKFGKTIYVNEFSVPSAYITNSGWWHQPWDEPTQAEYLENFYTVAFSKPLVRLINWAWGSTDQDAFTISGGLLKSDLKPKLAYQALKRLIESWRTLGTGTTDTNGELSFKGFAGDYEISIHTPDGQKFLSKVHIYEQEEHRFTLQH
jgi:GH35 family endo-1,4-beta-xylanase